MAEARVTNTEGKLADYNQKLNKRTEKLNELHIKLKLRKDKMMEREERLRQFEKGEITHTHSKWRCLHCNTIISPGREGAPDQTAQ